VCPHGKAIPPGACCRALSRPSEPLVQPLQRLAPGETGRIVHIVPREARRLMRLANLGVVPGALVRLQQKSPAVVLRVGETTLAVEPEFADEIYVKRVG
jgi:DtxR family Mn-dependent transcriptional regulator